MPRGTRKASNNGSSSRAAEAEFEQLICDGCTDTLTKEEALSCSISKVWLHCYCAGVPRSRFADISSMFVCIPCSLSFNNTVMMELRSEIAALKAEIVELKSALNSTVTDLCLCSVSSVKSSNAMCIMWLLTSLMRLTPFQTVSGGSELVDQQWVHFLQLPLTGSHFRKEICAVFYDYRKAFDSIPHRPLLSKLKSLDVNSYVLRWIADYLNSRTQCVIVEGDRYSTAKVLSGVPQGSILGPLLFLIYINEINLVSLSPESSRVVYADDVCIYRPISSCRDLRYVQDDLEAVEAWSIENFLNLNPLKCKYMLISRKRTPSIPDEPLILTDLPLQKVDAFKYLGVLLSQELSWSPHVQVICSKAKELLGLLYRKFYGCSNTDTLLQLYISLVHPHLEYACPVSLLGLFCLKMV